MSKSNIPRHVAHFEPVYCVSDCRNFKCRKVIRPQKVITAAARKLELNYKDLSSDCSEYVPVRHCWNGGNKKTCNCGNCDMSPIKRKRTLVH